MFCWLAKATIREGPTLRNFKLDLIILQKEIYFCPTHWLCLPVMVFNLPPPPCLINSLFFVLYCKFGGDYVTLVRVNY